jgi:hypothetical protein
MYRLDPEISLGRFNTGGPRWAEISGEFAFLVEMDLGLPLSA